MQLNDKFDYIKLGVFGISYYLFKIRFLTYLPISLVPNIILKFHVLRTHLFLNGLIRLRIPNILRLCINTILTN